MVKYMILAYVVAALVGYHFWKNMPRPVPPKAPAGVDEVLWNRGRVMYKVNCTSCHNTNPDLQGPVGPKLRGVSEDLLTDRLKNGKNGMPAQPRMLRFVPALREFLK